VSVSVCPVLSVTLVYCGQRVGRIKMKLSMQVGLGPGYIVLDGDQVSVPQRGTALQFPVYICCDQMARWIKVPLGSKVGLDPSDIMLDEDPAPLPKRAQTYQFSGIVCCAQMAGWIKMPLGMEVGLSPCDSVLDGNPDPSPQRGWSSVPNFRPISIVAKRLDASRCHLVWR